MSNPMTNVQAPAERMCKQCGKALATQPAYAGPASDCGPCWETRVASARDALKDIRARRIHRNALASEYLLSRGEATVGRLILFRDGLGLCVRFMSALDGASEILLEETLKGLLGSWPHDYLEAEIIPASFEKKAEDGG